MSQAPVNRARRTVGFQDQQQQQTNGPSHSEIAKSSATEGIVLLHRNIQPIADQLSTKIITSFATEHRLKEAVKKLEVVEFLPRPIRFKFELRSTKYTKNDPSFTTLAQQAKDSIVTCQNELKAIMVSTAKLELRLMQRRTIQLIFESTAFMAKTCIKCITMTETDDNIFMLFMNGMVHQEIHDWINKSGLKFNDYLKELPIVTPANGVADDFEVVTDARHEDFKKIIKKIFINPKAVMMNAINEKILAIELSKLAKLHISEKATTTTIMELEEEQAVDHAHLDELIERKVQQRTKNLQKQIADLNKQKNSKNSNRGAISPSNSASSTNKSKKDKEDKKSKDKSKKNSKATNNASNSTTLARTSTAPPSELNDAAKRTVARANASPKRANGNGSASVTKKRRTGKGKKSPPTPK
jgi:hypothetical protein